LTADCYAFLPRQKALLVNIRLGVYNHIREAIAGLCELLSPLLKMRIGMKKRHLSDVEQKVLAVIQKGFPNSLSPYEDMAAKADMETEQLLGVLKKWKRQGKLRRVGAVVNHFKAGLGIGAMVAWQVEPERIEEAGHILAGFKQVSHAYERETAENWPYNLYTMVHTNNIEDVERIVRQMSQACGVTKYRVLLTERELKKVPPTYVTPEREDEQIK